MASNNPLQQTGHANNGSSCFSASLRVSRLLSFAFGEESKGAALAAPCHNHHRGAACSRTPGAARSI
jgi:hypothetical protein